MEYTEQRPAAAWARWVECGWCAETSAAFQEYAVRPDGCLDIVFSTAEGLRAVGTMTGEQRFCYPAGTRIAGVRFHPGMAGTFLRVAPADLTDGIVRMEDVWGTEARTLEERLRQARSPGETMRLLLAGIPKPDASPNSVQRAIEAITAGHGTSDLELVARQANLGVRQFRRRCLEESGLAPKHLSRVLRFRYACELARNSQQPEWTSIALEAGYFDQAHLIRDFHEFAGGSPMTVFSNTAAGRPE